MAAKLNSIWAAPAPSAAAPAPSKPAGATFAAPPPLLPSTDDMLSWPPDQARPDFAAAAGPSLFALVQPPAGGQRADVALPAPFAAIKSRMQGGWQASAGAAGGAVAAVGRARGSCRGA
jgi:hypothetical protein